MTTTMTAVPLRSADSLPTLARYEIRRYLRSPIFLAGLAGLIWTLAANLRPTIVDANSRPISPVVLIGEIGFVVAFRLTQSMHRSAEALDVAPTSMPTRTAALCFTAIVPLVLGGLSLLAILLFQHGETSYTYGAFSTADRVAILAGQVVLPSLGAPLLGVAVARWVRFPWAVIVFVLAMNAWVIGVDGLAATYRDSFAVLVLRMFAPFAFFTTLGADGGVESWRGSPGFFLGWQLCLCAGAVTVALLRGAAPPLRRRLLRTLAVALALAALMYALAVTGGLGHAIVTNPYGTVESI
jgi:hypothetical protein